MNRSKQTRMLAMGILLIFVLALPASAALAAPGDPATYAITVENLTGTQPLSPPVFVTHAPGYNLFRLGTFASDGLTLIAETGNNSVAAAEAMASPFTFDVVAQDALVMPGQSTMAEVHAPFGARLSLAAMLGITNDGFTGLDGLRLPVGGSVTIELPSYDAGSEANNELATHVGALGGHLRAPTRYPIGNHAGILGIGDMDPAMYGWTDPVARVTITRVD